MTLGIIEIGGWASALIAIVTLISKMIGLITSIQSLISRIDAMQAELEKDKSNLDNHESRIHYLEMSYIDQKQAIKELTQHALS